METIFKDCRFGLRMLVKNPALSAVAIIALMLGIGANSAIFSVVNAVLLKPLPYDESNRLMWLGERSQVLDDMSISYPNFQDWRSQNEVFEGIAVYRRQSLNLTGQAEPERLEGGLVSADLFPLLRVQPELGRVFTSDEDKPGAEPVAVLSHSLWQRRFGGDRGIIGQAITLSDKQYAVIGVMPAGFQFPTRVELWMPAGQESGSKSWVQRGNHPGLYAIARLKPGVTVEQARSDMDSVAVQLERQYPDSNAGARITVRPYLEQIVRDIRPALLVLLGAVGFVLLIACANVANLLLARAASRQKEISIRVALGAGRLRLLRQLLTESVILALVGAGLGLVLAKVGVNLIVAAYPDSIPRSGSIGLDVPVVVFTALVAIGTGLLFGLVPALHSSKPDLNDSLKDAARGSSGGVGRARLRSILVVSEVALSVVLLIGAGLMLRSFYTLIQVDPGFKTDRLLTFNVNLPPAKYKEQDQMIRFYRQSLDRLKQVPGIQVAGLASGLPLGNNGNQTSFLPVGVPEPPASEIPLTEVALVSPDYFSAMRMPLLSGRGFTEQDNKDSPKVMVVDKLFAERYWPGEDAVGKRVLFERDPNIPPTTVIGVVGRVKMEGLDTDSGRVQSYFPYTQNTWNGMTFVVRTSTEPSSIAGVAREQIQAVDSGLPIYGVQTMEKIRSDSLAPQRLNLILLGLFAGIALSLAAVGIYGVMSYSVTQRTHEMGIRMALGASSLDVVGIVLKSGMGFALGGVTIGAAAAMGVTRLMSGLLFGVSSQDPLTFVTISGLLILVASVAAYLPARRATRVDPIDALRYE